MVKKGVPQLMMAFFILICGIAPHCCHATTVSAEIETNPILEYRPIAGVVIISHPRSDQVHTGSFHLGDQPLPVEFLDEEILPEQKGVPYARERYHFTIPSKPQGVYALPSISVKVGNQVYRTSTLAFAVQAVATDTVLLLDPVVISPHDWYPGQRGKFGYRISYKGEIALAQEELPLLNAKGFLKIGPLDVQEKVENGLNVQTITQEVRAVEGGEFIFPSAYVEGISYEEKRSGRWTKQKVVKGKIAARTQDVKVVVKPFPTQGRPPSFSGAVGQFSWKVKRLTPTKLAVGDRIQLSIEIEGSGEFDTVSFPNIACQPGFAGFFQMADWSSAGEWTGSAKRFLLDLFLSVPFVYEIASFEFSYFDPLLGQYQILRNPAIPIEVQSEKSPLELPSPIERIVEGKSAWRQQLLTPHTRF